MYCIFFLDLYFDSCCTTYVSYPGMCGTANIVSGPGVAHYFSDTLGQAQ